VGNLVGEMMGNVRDVAPDAPKRSVRRAPCDVADDLGTDRDDSRDRHY
jgi:hypothetical protein